MSETPSRFEQLWSVEEVQPTSFCTSASMSRVGVSTASRTIVKVSVRPVQPTNCGLAIWCCPGRRGLTQSAVLTTFRLEGL